jgi:hypothetical protein
MPLPFLEQTRIGFPSTQGFAMQADRLLNFTSAAVGFSSGLFFCLGTVRQRYSEIAAVAESRWNYNLDLARSLTDQHSRYLTGAVLLVIAFILQAVSATGSLAGYVRLPNCLESPWLILLGTFLVVEAASIAAERRYADHAFAKVRAKLGPLK